MAVVDGLLDGRADVLTGAVTVMTFVTKAVVETVAELKGVIVKALPEGVRDAGADAEAHEAEADADEGALCDATVETDTDAVVDADERADAVGVADAMAESLETAEPDATALSVGDTDAVSNADGECVGCAEPVGAKVAVGAALCDESPDTDGDDEAEAEPVADGVDSPDAVAAAEVDGDAVAELATVAEMLNVADAVAKPEPEGTGDRVADIDGDMDCVPELDAAADAESKDAVATADVLAQVLASALDDGDGEIVCVAFGERDERGDALVAAEVDALADARAEGDPETEPDDERDADDEPVARVVTDVLGVAAALAERADEREALPDDETDGDGEMVARDALGVALEPVEAVAGALGENDADEREDDEKDVETVAVAQPVAESDARALTVAQSVDWADSEDMADAVASDDIVAVAEPGAEGDTEKLPGALIEKDGVTVAAVETVRVTDGDADEVRDMQIVPVLVGMDGLADLDEDRHTVDELDTTGDAVDDVDSVAAAEPVAVAVEQFETRADAVTMLAVIAAVALGQPDTVPDTEADGVGRVDAENDAEPDGETDVRLDAVTDGDGLGERLPNADRDARDDTEGDGVPDATAEGDRDMVPVAERALLTDTAADGEERSELDGDGDTERDRVTVTDTDALPHTVAVNDGERVPPVALPVAVPGGRDTVAAPDVDLRAEADIEADEAGESVRVAGRVA